MCVLVLWCGDVLWFCGLRYVNVVFVGVFVWCSFCVILFGCEFRVVVVGCVFGVGVGVFLVFLDNFYVFCGGFGFLLFVWV
jgi:hypothetical protein